MTEDLCCLGEGLELLAGLSAIAPRHYLLYDLSFVDQALPANTILFNVSINLFDININF